MLKILYRGKNKIHPKHIIYLMPQYQYFLLIIIMRISNGNKLSSHEFQLKLRNIIIVIIYKRLYYIFLFSLPLNLVYINCLVCPLFDRKCYLVSILRKSFLNTIVNHVIFKT